jgi:citrate synthase
VINVDHVNIGPKMAEATLLDTAETARRLGVKPETVYAYVSRGLLRRHPDSARHRSLFAREDVERLAARSRRRDRSGALEVVVETELTLIDPAGRLYYRGHDVVELARFRSFEQVATLLWGGGPAAPWELGAELEPVVAAASPLLEEAAPADRIAVLVALLGAADPAAGERDADSVRRTGARLFAAVLAGLDAGEEPADRSVVARLWNGLAANPGDPGAGAPSAAQLAALDAALVLLADHELAASTLAARVAASAWAGPYRAVMAGLGPLGGVLHGGAGAAVEALLTGLDSPAAVSRLLDRHLGLEMPLPGFGHRVYRDRDPRADHLLTLLPRVAVERSEAELIAEFARAAQERGAPPPNVDFALAGLVRAMRLPAGSSVAIFSFARIAGILAHALEEYAHRLRFRPRASYVGPSPL